ncbi:MAG: hypothetical protein M5U28_10135 [Sandaracinaceae bacterium]|nr:hypothetical protein [Sandaracinaceae bacterium]
MTSARRAEELLERGYTVFEGLYTDEEVSRMREPIARRYEALGSPPTFARPPLEPAPGVEISIVGLILHKLGAHAPELAPLVLRAEVAEAARAVLGEGVFLEYTAAVVNHGEEAVLPVARAHGRRRQRRVPQGRPLPALRGLGPRHRAHLPRRSHRRRRGAARAPAAHLRRDEAAARAHAAALAGAGGAPCRRGTVVLLEQCTWHAARPKRSPGLRAFIAFYLTSARAAPPSWVDDSFRAHAAGAPVLASLLPAR